MDAPMLPWPDVRQRIVWWGGLIRRTREKGSGELNLAVVSPSLDAQQREQRVEDITEWLDQKSHYKFSGSVLLAVTVVLALAVAGVSTVDALWLRILFSFGAVVALLIVYGTAPTLLRLWREPGPPQGVAWRAGVDETLYNLVRHLNSYRGASDDARAAVHGLLWALAHTDPTNPRHQAAIAELGEQFSGWDEHAPEDIRYATSQLWSTLQTVSPENSPDSR